MSHDKTFVTLVLREGIGVLNSALASGYSVPEANCTALIYIWKEIIQRKGFISQEGIRLLTPENMEKKIDGIWLEKALLAILSSTQNQTEEDMEESPVP